MSNYCYYKKILIKFYYDTQSGIVIKGGLAIMNENGMELIKLIRENDNPEQALMTAAVIILGYLKQHESSEEQAAVCLPALG